MEFGRLTLNNLPFRQRVMLICLLWLGTGYLCYIYMIRDLRLEVTQLRSQIQNLQHQVDQAKLVEARLAEFKSELAIQQGVLEDFRQKLPNRKETPALMNRIQQLAVENNLKITTFTPQPVEQREFYVDWPIKMTMEGNYHNLASFFEGVGKMSRLVSIGEVSVRATEVTSSKERTIGAACTATTFVYLEETGA